MSDSLALVRFQDGDLRVAYYFGSTDMVVPPLFGLGEADAVMEGGMEVVLERLQEVEGGGEEPDDIEEVEVWTAYGGGAHWPGRASRQAAVLVEGIDPYGNGAGMGSPPEPTRAVTEGTPAWVPSEWRERA